MFTFTIKKIFIFLLLIFCLSLTVKIYVGDKNIFTEEEYKKIEKQLTYEMAKNTFGSATSDNVSKEKNNDNELTLKEIFINHHKNYKVKKNNNYAKQLDIFVKNHEIYRTNSLENSEKKIAYLYSNLIVKNIYKDFYFSIRRQFRAINQDKFNHFQDMFENYFFDTYNKNICSRYSIDLEKENWKQANNTENYYNEDKNYNKPINIIKNRENFKKYIKEICINGYCDSLLNAYIFENINDFAKDQLFYKINMFTINFNQKNKKDVFDTIDLFLANNNDLFQLSNIMKGFKKNPIFNQLEPVKDEKNKNLKWKILNNFVFDNKKEEVKKNEEVIVYEGTSLNELFQECLKYYDYYESNIMPKKIIKNEDNLQAFLTIKELEIMEKSFSKTLWVTQQNDNDLLSNLNKWRLFDIKDINNNDNIFNYKNKSFLTKKYKSQKKDLIFNDDSKLYIIELVSLINDKKISFFNKNKNRNISINDILELSNSLIENNKNTIKYKSLNYFIKQNIKNKNIKFKHKGFENLLKRKYAI
ncbi:MAG: hypothetical protein J6Y70_00715 [Bacilli bacterium]|nr:hypothetical protein [Bacilli bacterium]